MPRLGTPAQPIFKIGQLLNHIAHWQPRQIRVLRTALPVWQVAVAASENLRRPAVRNDARHRRMIGRMPVRRAEEICSLGERERRIALWHAPQGAIGHLRCGGRFCTRWINDVGPVRGWFMQYRRLHWHNLILCLGNSRPHQQQRPALARISKEVLSSSFSFTEKNPAIPAKPCTKKSCHPEQREDPGFGRHYRKSLAEANTQIRRFVRDDNWQPIASTSSSPSAEHALSHSLADPSACYARRTCLRSPNSLPRHTA